MLGKYSVLAMATVMGGLGLVASPAAADDGVRITFGGGSVRIGSSCSWHGHLSAGTIIIDGCRTQIRSGCDVRQEIVRAFRIAGYDAECRDGAVVVRYGRCRPSVQWYAGGWGTSFSWHGGCLSIRAYENQCGSCRDDHRPWPGSRHDDRDDRDHGHRDRDHRPNWGKRWPSRGCR
jgi:hypothetical protein